MAYLMVMMQAFFLFLCFLLLEECSCNEANVAAKMLDDANSQRKRKKTRAQKQWRIVAVAALCPLGFWMDGGFGILELAAGNYISAGSMLLWLLPAFLPLGFWDAGFLESWNYEAGKYVSAGARTCGCSGSKNQFKRFQSYKIH